MVPSEGADLTLTVIGHRIHIWKSHDTVSNRLTDGYRDIMYEKQEVDWYMFRWIGACGEVTQEGHGLGMKGRIQRGMKQGKAIR
jgi:hypothetical protein